MHPPRLLDQQPGVRRHGVAIAQDVLQPGDTRPRRVRRLARLRELLRITDQHQVRRGAGHGQDVGQRELPRLVDEQGIRAARELRA
jgi:hypothetical protein